MKTLYYWQDHEGQRYDLYSCPNQQSPSLSPVQLDLTEPWFPQRKLNLIICRWFWRLPCQTLRKLGVPHYSLHSQHWTVDSGQGTLVVLDTK